MIRILTILVTIMLNASALGAEEKTPDQELERAITIALNKTPLVKNIISIVIDQNNNNQRSRMVDVSFDFKPGFTLRLTRVGIERGMMNVYEAVYTSGIPVTQANVEAYMDIIDVKGNESSGLVYSTSLKRIDAKGINWENRLIIKPSAIWHTWMMNSSFKDT